MPSNKNAYMRYKVLDECFRDWRRYTWKRLLAAVNSELDRHSYTPVSVSTIRADVEFLKSEEGGGITLETLRDGHEVYLRYTDPDFSILQQEITPREMQQLTETVEMLSRLVVLPIDRMSDVHTVDDVEFRPESAYQIEHHFQNNVGVSVQSEGKIEVVRVKAWNYAVDYMETKPLHSSQRVINDNANENGEDYKIFEWQVQVNEELVQQLLVYADQCEILQPESLKNKISERAI